MQSLSFDISGMTCVRCTGSVQRTLSELGGIAHAGVTLHPGVATVSADTSRVTPARIEAAIAGLSYFAKARPADHGALVGA